MPTFTKTTTVDQITVTENGTVLYREATRIMEDGEQLSQTFHRTSLTPAQDLTGQPANVVAICNAAWTTEVVDAYRAAIAAQEAARVAANEAAQAAHDAQEALAAQEAIAAQAAAQAAAQEALAAHVAAQAAQTPAT